LRTDDFKMNAHVLPKQYKRYEVEYNEVQLFSVV
jgi:hypothetical protein